MRLATIGDLHITERPCRSDVGLDAQAAILVQISKDIDAADLDAILIGGDIYDGRSTSRERAIVWSWLRHLGAIHPTVVIRGNHDDPLDIEALNYLDGVTAYVSAPENVLDLYRVGNLGRIGVIPWPSVKLENGAELLANYVRGLVAMEPSFILGHLDLVGAKLDGGQESTGKVNSVLTVDDFGGIPTALGHYHKRAGLYVGGIRQMKFGDDAAKGFGIYDTDAKSWEWFGPYGRRLWTVEFKKPWDSGMISGLTDVAKASANDLIRVRYTVSEDEAKQRRETAEKITANFPCAVVIEPKVIADTRTRGAEVASATTPREKLEAFWGSARPARADQIVEKMEAVS